MINKLDSIKHDVALKIRNLHQKEKRISANHILLYGIEHIKWAMEEGLLITDIIFEKSNENLISHIYKILGWNGKTNFYSTNEGIIKKLAGTNYLLPVIGLASKKDFKMSDDFSKNRNYHEDIIVMLDDVVDFGNLGSIIRSANAFSINKFVILGENSADAFQRKAIDASRGLVFSSEILHSNDKILEINNLKKAGFAIASLSPNADVILGKDNIFDNIEKFQLSSESDRKNKKIVLIFGNETRGVSKKVLENVDLSLKISMSSFVESLNVSVCAGIVFYAITKYFS